MRGPYDELSAPTRALLDAARDGLGPDAAAIARMRGKIGVAVAGGAAAATTAGVLANKLGLLALALAVGTGAAVLATRSSEPENVSVAAPSIEAPAPTAVTVRESVPHAVVEPPVIEMEPTSVTKPLKVKPAARTVDLKREVELVDRAMASLRAGDTDGALAAVRLHATETGGAGQLAEDAAAIEIDALCKRKDPVATQKLAAFDQRWPTSAQRSKLCR